MSNNYQEAIKALSNAKTVKEWNQIRSQWTDILSQGELAYIDASGLIVKLLGKDETYGKV